MSDFDKEAERERLREKYEAERQDRAATQRMSELLLKGATMTNRHCEECGSPIFRHDGQEFCPNCQAGAADATAADAADETAADAGDETPEADTEAAAAEPGSAGDTASGDVAAGAEPAAAEGGATPSEPADSTSVGSVAPAETGGRAPETGRNRAAGPASGAPDRSAGASTDGDLTGARADLRRALATQARAAAETTDPRSARDHLEAAREAAAALAALDDVRA